MTPLSPAGIDALAEYIRLNDFGDQHVSAHPWGALRDDSKNVYRGQARVLLTVYFAGAMAAPVAAPVESEAVYEGCEDAA